MGALNLPTHVTAEAWIIVPAWLVPPLLVIGIVVWIGSGIAKARQAAKDRRSSMADSRGIALTVSDGTVEQTARALAEYLKVPRGSLSVAFSSPAVRILVRAEQLSSPLLVVCSSDCLCVRSRQGSREELTFIERRVVRSAEQGDPTSVRLVLIDNSPVELRFESPDQAEAFFSWSSSAQADAEIANEGPKG